MEKEARTLVSAGYRVSVLGWDRTAALPLREEKDGYVIHRLPIKAEFGKGLANFPALLGWQLGLSRWLVRHRKEFDVVHACDFDTVMPALILKWTTGKRVVYDIFDFYADHLRATPEWIKAIIRRIDLFAVEKVDAVILADENRRSQLAYAQPERLTFVYNTPDEIPIPDLERSLPRPQFTIAYVGLLQVERGLMTLLDVLEKHPDWGLWLAGFGGDQELILQKASRLPHVHFFGRIPYEKALALSQAADVLIATYDPAIPNHRYSSPNKIFEAMMLAKPIIVAHNTNMDRIVSSEQCGMVVNYGVDVELELALRQLADDRDLRRRLGLNGRRAYESTYRWEIMANRLIHLYRQLLAANG